MCSVCGIGLSATSSGAAGETRLPSARGSLDSFSVHLLPCHLDIVSKTSTLMNTSDDTRLVWIASPLLPSGVG